MSRVAIFLAMVSFAFGSAGCASKDAVSVSASLGNAKVQVTQGALVGTLAGSVDLSMELGERASDSTNVSLTSLSLVKASDDSALITKPLSVIASQVMPIHLEPGGKAVVSFTIAASTASPTQPMEIANAEVQALCAAGGVKFVSVISDTGSGRNTPVSSMVLSPSGCP